MQQAEAADKARAEGADDPLLGIPLAYKDVLCTRGVQTTCGSKILEGYKPPYTATSIEKLEARGYSCAPLINTTRLKGPCAPKRFPFNFTVMPGEPFLGFGFLSTGRLFVLTLTVLEYAESPAALRA